MIVRQPPRDPSRAFVILPDGDGWALKCVPATAELARGARQSGDLTETLDQVRLLAELLTVDDLTRTLATKCGAI